MTGEREDPNAGAEQWTWLALVFCLVLIAAAVLWLWRMWPE